MFLFAGLIFDLDADKYAYLKEVKNAGSCEGIMLLDSLFGAFIVSVFLTKTFRLSLVLTG